MHSAADPSVPGKYLRGRGGGRSGWAVAFVHPFSELRSGVHAGIHTVGGGRGADRLSADTSPGSDTAGYRLAADSLRAGDAGLAEDTVAELREAVEGGGR